MISLGLEWLWAALAGAVGLVALWFGGRRSAKQDAKLDAAKTYIETRERIDRVETPTDPDLAREWLRKRGEQ